MQKLLVNNKLFLETEIKRYDLSFRVAISDMQLYFLKQPVGLYRRHESNSSNDPLKQIRSFFYDVLPLYHKILRKELKTAYRKKIWSLFKNTIRQMLLGKAHIDAKLVYTMAKQLI